MLDIISWLILNEQKAATVYKKAASIMSGDVEFAGFLTELASDEDEHWDAITKASVVAEGKKRLPDLVRIDKDTEEKIGGYFLLCEKRIETRRLTRADILDFIVATEFSEWNDLFVYVFNSLKRDCREFIPLAAKVQQHKRQIERFLASRPEYGVYLKRIKSLATVWQEKLLVVDDEEAIIDVLAAILEGEGMIERAGNGEEALEKLGRGYYAAIVTDINMPRMSGVEFYYKAAAMFPGINSRFLFFTGDCGGETAAFISEHRLRCLQKPTSINAIRDSVIEILRR
ncbi:MAG: response regulator [Deltaproteobacteria bacterium]|nr:response regulator [Deltaproteobacteria bacterium]